MAACWLENRSGTGWPLSHLTDGDPGTAWRSDPLSGDPQPALMIDLRNEVYLDRVRLRGVSSSYGSQQLTVSVTADNYTVFIRRDRFAHANNSDWLEFNFSGMLARYIYITTEYAYSTTAGLSEIPSRRA